VQLVSDRDSIIVCQKECQAVRWCVPQDILALGQIMELSRLIPILRLAGSASPQVPAGFVLQELPLPSGDQTWTGFPPLAVWLVSPRAKPPSLNETVATVW